MDNNNLNNLNEQEITGFIQNFIEDNYKHSQMSFTGDKEILNSKESWYKEVVKPIVKLLNEYYNKGLLTKEHISLLYWGHNQSEGYIYNPRRWVFVEFKTVKEILGLERGRNSVSDYINTYNFTNKCYKCKKEFVSKVRTRSDLLQVYSRNKKICPECDKKYFASLGLFEDSIEKSIKVTKIGPIIKNIPQQQQNFKIIDFSKSYNELLHTLKYMPYEEYLQTEHWLHFRDEALKWSQNKCQLCGKTYNLNIHHKTYENRGRETFNDVIVLCQDCHAKFHDK